MLSDLFSRRAQKPEERGGFEVVLEAWRSNRAAAGGYVSPTTAMQNSAVWACMLVIGDTVASLPLIIYERAGRGKNRAQGHGLYPVLHDQANEFMTAFEFREFMQVSLLAWGNAYAQLTYDGRGRITGLWPLQPGRMQDVRVINGRKIFSYQTENGEIKTLTDNEVWHIPGMGSNGIVGLSPIAMMRRSIGLSNSAEEFGARFFENDARPGIVLEHPAKLGKQAYENLRDSWAETHQGVGKSHKPAILEEGMKLHEIGIPPEDAQFLETRKFQLNEIARIFRVPPHMIGDLDKATFSNIEQQSLDFVIHSVRPWLVRWEQSIHKHLLPAEDQPRFYAEFLVDGLLRGDITARYGAYAMGRQNGWLSANDIRELENMNPVDGGDVYLVPLNMVPADQVGELPGSTEGRDLTPFGGKPPQSPSRTGKGKEDKRELRWAEMDAETREARSKRSAAMRHRLQRSYRRVIKDLAARMMRREVHDVKEAARKWLKTRATSDFQRWLTDFYEDHKGYIERQMNPAMQAYGEMVATEAANEIAGEMHDEETERFMRAYVRTYAGRHAGNHEKRLMELVQEALNTGQDVLEAVEAELDWMEESLPDEIAFEESVRANNAAAKLIYGLNAISTLRWSSFGENCPYCSNLDGMTVSISANFIDEGQAFQPEGADTPLAPGRDVGHPPAHKGCDCMITAG